MTHVERNQRKEDQSTPKNAWVDPIVRRLRTNRIIVAIYLWVSKRLVPLLFAIFIAAPIGLLILPLFIPKFIRNARRRKKYDVHLSTDQVHRIEGTRPPPTGGAGA
jgi:hypothetical protein